MSAPARTRSDLVEVEPAAWDALLDELGLADAYLRRAYVEASALLDAGRPAFLRSGSAVFAGLVREIPRGGGLLDVTTPYGYGGPLAAGADDAARFYAAYDRWAREAGVVTTFVRYHPLLENHRLAPPPVRRERLADAASWRLDRHESAEALFAAMHRSHRNKCRKARAASVEVAVDRAPRELDAFVDLHAETMARRDADPFYRFPPEYWGRLANGLGEELVRIEARARAEGELVASALVLASGPRLYYHMGVASDRGRALGASNLVVYEAARWGKEHGFAELHLGSGVGGREDSLWAFKHRFSPASARELWIGKLVHDAVAYRELAGTAAVDGFFPAYRR